MLACLNPLYRAKFARPFHLNALIIHEMHARRPFCQFNCKNYVEKKRKNDMIGRVCLVTQQILRQRKFLKVRSMNHTKGSHYAHLPRVGLKKLRQLIFVVRRQ